MRATSWITKFLALVAMTALLSLSAAGTLAQDSSPTPEPPVSDVTPTEVPTDIPTAVPSDVPTDVPVIPSEQPTEVPPTLPAEIQEALEQASQTPAPIEELPFAPTSTVPSVDPNLFNDDFQDNETTGWSLSPGWAIQEQDGNRFLSTLNPNEAAILQAVNWPFFTLSFRTRIETGNSVILTLASGVKNYQIQINADSSTSISLDGALLGQSAGLPVDPAAPFGATWHTVQILAPGNLLAVKVDDLLPVSVSDAGLLGVNLMMFTTGSTNSGTVALDDVGLTRLDAPPTGLPITETPVVVATEEVTFVPLPDVTAEATIEAESTTEATVEATAEATLEAEATAEATLDPEATAEAEAPLSLSEAGRAKMPPALGDALALYLSGDEAGAQVLAAEYAIVPDENNRLSVVIWANSEAEAATVAATVQADGGIITETFSIRVTTLLDWTTVIKIANMPEVSGIEVPLRAVSTGPASGVLAAPIGPTISEGYDAVGAEAWHDVSITGTGVNIAVIDTGFNGAITAEHGCLGSTGVTGGVGSGAHGLRVVEVLCDVASGAKVYMYSAFDGTSLANTLNIINSSGAFKVILITLDLGASASPGDGTGGNAVNPMAGVYGALSAARQAGRIVIVSAGNNNGRYVTLNATATISMTVFGGDIIHASWNAWTGGGATASFTSGIPGVAGMTPLAGRPGAFAVVPASSCATGCAATLTVTPGGGAIVQVQIAGRGTLTPPGAGVVANAGSMGRPADSTDVISVGAACIDPLSNFPIMDDSARGPLYSPGGNIQVLPAPPYSRNLVKPDVVGPSHVSISTSAVDTNADPQDYCSNGTGFNGTSAAAAHVAGMVALLTSNTNTGMNAFDNNGESAFIAMKNYLQTHTVDLSATTAPPNQLSADGFDMIYGAGLTGLGSPTFDLSIVANPPAAPDNLAPYCPSAPNTFYVGQANLDVAPDGSISKPFFSIAQAIRQAGLNDCVVVMPGEYTTPIFVPTGEQPRGLVSYDAAANFYNLPTYLWLNKKAPSASAAINVLKNNFSFAGFTVNAGKVRGLFDGVRNLDLFTVEMDSSLVSTSLIIDSNIFVGFSGPLTIRNAPAARITNNIFQNFKRPPGQVSGGVQATAALYISRSGWQDTDGGPGITPAFISTVVVEGNSFFGNEIEASQNVPLFLPSVIGVEATPIHIYRNRFVNNKSAALVGISQWYVVPIFIGPGDPGNTTGNALNAATGEVRFFSNVMTDNDVQGPVINLLKSDRTRFINNTVVNNTMSASGFYDAMVLYGNPGLYASDPLVHQNQQSSRRLELHNNLFYKNGGTSAGLVSDPVPGLLIGCDSFNGTDVPLRNNWFVPATMPDSGACANQLGDTNVSGSITEVIDDTNESKVFFGSVGTYADPNNPWRLLPILENIYGNPFAPACSPSITGCGGLNRADETVLVTLFGASYKTVALDIIGGERVKLSPNITQTPTVDRLDVGAYELDVPQPPAADLVTATVNEDTGAVSLTLKATGGYVNTFTVTSGPANFNSDPNSACRGQAFVFIPPKTVTYCPPPDFHTQYGTNQPVIIPFSVEDRVFYPGQVTSNQMRVTITPVNESGTPDAQDFTIVTDYTLPVTYQLTPAYQTDNFGLTRMGQSSSDFPFDYQFVSQDSTNNANLLLCNPGCTSTQQVITDALNAAETNGGRITINPVIGQTGFYRFNYRVVDRDGQATPNRVATIVVLPSLAREGIWDDTSLAIAYQGNGWVPYLGQNVYSNNNLHYTLTVNDRFEFPFAGNVIRMNLISAIGITNTLKLEFNTSQNLASNQWKTYAETKTALGADFSCINSLNGLEPDAQSNTLNGAAGYATYTLICRGFNADQANSVRVAVNPGGSGNFLIIDQIEVGSGILKPGTLYNEDSLNLLYKKSWVPYTATGPVNNRMVYTLEANATIDFKIQGTGMALYRLTGPLAGLMEVCIDGICNLYNGYAPAYLWQQPLQIRGLSDSVHTVRIRNASTDTRLYIDLDAIEVFGQPGILTPGVVYEDTSDKIAYSAGWVSYAAPSGPAGGSVRYTTRPGASFSFRVQNSGGFIIRRLIYPTAGNMRIELNGELLRTINNTGSFQWTQPITITGLKPDLTHVITVRFEGTTAQFIDVDQIEALPAPVPLVPSVTPYDNTSNDIVFSGSGWTSFVGSGPFNNTMNFSYGSSDFAYFDVTQARRVVLYRSIGPSAGSMSVDVQERITGAPFLVNNNAGAIIYQRPYIINGLDPLKTYRITIRNTSGTTSRYIDLDAVQVSGAIGNLAPGYYEESFPDVTFKDPQTNWVEFINSAASGASSKYSINSGAGIEFNVTQAKRVILYRATANNGGSMQVCYQEGVIAPVCSAVSNFSSALLFRQSHMIILPDATKNYKITITNNSGFMDLDAVEVLADNAVMNPTTKVRYEENDPRIGYNSAKWISSNSAGPSGGAFRYTLTNNDSYTFKVTNAISAQIIRSVGPTTGNAVVQLSPANLDGISSFNMTNTVPLFAWQQGFTIPRLNPAITYTFTVTSTVAAPAVYGDIDAIVLQPLTAAIGPGFYENDDLNIEYGSGWESNVGVTGPSAGTMHLTSTLNATAKFQLTNQTSGFILYRAKYPTNAGTMRVRLNNGTGTQLSPDTFVGTASALTYQTLTYIQLPPDRIGQVNTVEIINTIGNQYIDIDAIQVLPTSTTTPLPIGVYEETEARLIYSGGWRDVSGVSGVSGGRLRLSVTANDTVSFSINGDGLVIYRQISPTGGSMRVRITKTGVTPPIVDTTYQNFSTTTLNQQPITIRDLGNLSGSPLSPPYNVLIENVSTIAGLSINIDKVEVVGAAQPLTPGVYESNNSNVIYAGPGWTSFFVAGPSNNDLDYTLGNNPNSRAKFFITGAGFTLYGSRGSTIGGSFRLCVWPGQIAATNPADCTNPALNPVENRVVDIGPSTGPFKWQQPASVRPLTNGTYTVAIFNLSSQINQFIDLDKIEVFAEQTPLTPGLYQEDNLQIAYDDPLAWLTYAAPSDSGPSKDVIRYTVVPNARFSFRISNANAVAILRTGYPTAGAMKICAIPLPSGTESCITNTATSAGLAWQFPATLSGLNTGTSYNVVVTNESPTNATFIDLDAIYVLNTASPLPLQPGLNEETNPNITYSGTDWQVDPTTGTAASPSRFTTVPNAQASFSFTGTGFSIISYAPTNGAPMQICYTQAGQPEICNTDNGQPAVSTAGTGQFWVGYSVSGLKQGTHTARIRNLTATNQRLTIMSILVYGNQGAALTPGTYEENALGISYGPVWQWSTQVGLPIRDAFGNLLGYDPPYSGTTQRSTSMRGGLVQFRMQGTSFILYQSTGPSGTAVGQMCASTDAGNYHTRPRCVTFSQNGALSYQVPIAFLGLGNGTHTVGIESLNFGQTLSVDSIVVNK